MKRITLNMDLNENEAFDEQVSELIRAKVREIVRSECSTLIKEEAKNESDRQLRALTKKKNGFVYYTYDETSPLQEFLKEEISKNLSQAVKEIDIYETVKELTNKVLSDGRISRECERILNEHISNELINKIHAMLQI